MNQAQQTRLAQSLNSVEKDVSEKRDFDSILAAIKANHGKVIDDHRFHCGSGEERMRSVYAIAKFGDKTVFLCSPEETPYFCLNGMYVDPDGVAHLSQWSVGGVIEFGRRGTLDTAIAKYNDPASWVPGHSFTPITDVTYI